MRSRDGCVRHRAPAGWVALALTIGGAGAASAASAGSDGPELLDKKGEPVPFRVDAAAIDEAEANEMTFRDEHPELWDGAHDVILQVRGILTARLGVSDLLSGLEREEALPDLDTVRNTSGTRFLVDLADFLRQMVMEDRTWATSLPVGADRPKHKYFVRVSLVEVAPAGSRISPAEAMDRMMDSYHDMRSWAILLKPTLHPETMVASPDGTVLVYDQSLRRKYYGPMTERRSRADNEMVAFYYESKKPEKNFGAGVDAVLAIPGHDGMVSDAILISVYIGEKDHSGRQHAAFQKYTEESVEGDDR